MGQVPGDNTGPRTRLRTGVGPQRDMATLDDARDKRRVA